MSRSGVEEKPPWREVHTEVKAAVDHVTNGRVAVGNRVWGGYGPSPTYRLRLEDGRRVFLKGVYPGSNEFQRAAHGRELRVYSELQSLISAWAPDFIAEFEAGDWRVMLLEDLGAKSAPPWRPSVAKKITTQLAEFHESTIGVQLPAWVKNVDQVITLSRTQWSLERDDHANRRLAALAGPLARDAETWLGANTGALADAATAYYEQGRRDSLLHRDVRSDNLRFTGGRLKLFDWPHVVAGGPEFDCVGFAQTVELEGGPSAETVLDWYSSRLRLSPERVSGALAVVSGYFAFHAWQPAVPGLPRLRPFQSAQLRVTLRWAAKRLGLTEPRWVDEVAARMAFKS